MSLTNESRKCQIGPLFKLNILKLKQYKINVFSITSVKIWSPDRDKLLSKVPCSIQRQITFFFFSSFFFRLSFFFGSSRWELDPQTWQWLLNTPPTELISYRPGFLALPALSSGSTSCRLPWTKLHAPDMSSSTCTVPPPPPPPPAPPHPPRPPPHL